MAVERVTLQAIRYTDERGAIRHHIPLLDPSDGTWWCFTEDGASVYRSADDVRRFADEWDADPEMQPDEAEIVASYRALAELLDEASS